MLKGLVLRRDEAHIMFMVNDHLGAPRMTGTLYVETSNVLELHRGLAGQVEILWGPEIYEYGMHEFAIRDCDGYTISFGQPTETADSSSGSEKSVTGRAEKGVPEE